LFISSYGDLDQEMLLATIVATVVSGIVGLAVIHYLLRYLESGSFMPFVAWRVIVGLWLLWMLASGSIAA